MSRSEAKRRARAVEELAVELLALSPAEIRDLPAAPQLREELRHGRGLTGPAAKRQRKFIAKLLRQTDTEPLLAFLAQRKGSALERRKRFHEVERLRDALVTDVLAAWRQAEDEGREPPADHWPSPALEAIGRRYPGLDLGELWRLATAFARSRNRRHSREIFRLLAGAAEMQRFQRDGPQDTSPPAHDNLQERT